MIIFPAIDLKNGECVRLFKGEFDTVHKVAESHTETAQNFINAGAEWIHMIDLDGAKEGTRKNREIIFDIAKNTTLKVQTGGGIRTMNDIEDCLKNGISRVIIGSAAVKDPMFVKNVVLNFGDKIAVGIDEKRGAVAVEGWLENSGVSYLDLAKKMCENGVKYFIYTDIERDGMLNGPNHDKTKHLQKFASEYDVNVIASGGIKNIDDIIKLKKNSVYGAICGKSIYSGTLDLSEAIAYCKKEI